MSWYAVTGRTARDWSLQWAKKKKEDHIRNVPKDLPIVVKLFFHGLPTTHAVTRLIVFLRHNSESQLPDPCRGNFLGKQELTKKIEMKITTAIRISGRRN